MHGRATQDRDYHARQGRSPLMWEKNRENICMIDVVATSKLKVAPTAIEFISTGKVEKL
jgi:hypothetical protein